MAQKKAHEVDSFVARPSGAFPLVLIYGPDKGLVAERAALFAKNTGVALDDPFSTIRMEAADVENDPARLGDEAKTVSLFGGGRLIWIRNAGAQKKLADTVKWLLAENTLQQTWLLIEAGDLKKTAPLRTVVEQGRNGMALPCYSDDARAIDQLIDQILGEFDMRISLDARKFLRDCLGGDRLASRGELEKLCFYAKGRDMIGVEDIAAIISDVSALSYDEVIDAVIGGNPAALDSGFDRQLAGGASLFSILSAAQRQFQQLQQMRFIMDGEGKTASAVVAASRPPVFFRRQKLVEQALGLWSGARLEQALSRLHMAVLESRQNAALAASIIRQHLLALCIETSRQKTR
ncbi:MAG: DNA polymerase III delta subunit [Candidatus Tokpelaia hoelldobleri]|uniref:DNA-directed DNA polymerase n=1 Tax=Candidatus Tokpelaia hoelldobleri TaxID=1902579 RepID=A0A1U9JWZ8_9HYPH|nr:MAG: DNA polymerase III delta subunit [Candidatus Tokpelaia hoelldoblerii]